MFGNEKIKKLEEEVIGLHREIDMLNKIMMHIKRENKILVYSKIRFPDSMYKAPHEFDVRDVVDKILNHLNLGITLHPAQPEFFSLEPINNDAESE